MYPNNYNNLLQKFFAFIVIAINLCEAVANTTDDHPNWEFLPKKECGFGAMADRIIGGKEATLGQFPWIARIGYQIKMDNKNLYYLCAGSIINRWYVVTANHCFLDVLGNSIKQVRLGENFLKQKTDCESDVCAPAVQDIDMDYFVRFNDYVGKPQITYGDIGLIKLKTPIEFNDFVMPICLPRGEVLKQIDDYLSHGQSIEVAGWGTTTAEVNRIPNKLMYVHMPVVNINICKKNFPKNLIDESHLCVGIGEGKDSCVGDSGGPLMKPIVLDAPPRYFLFGVVSYGMKWCGVSAAVYTNVAHYMKWILDHMKPIP